MTIEEILNDWKENDNVTLKSTVRKLNKKFRRRSGSHELLPDLLEYFGYVKVKTVTREEMFNYTNDRSVVGIIAKYETSETVIGLCSEYDSSKENVVVLALMLMTLIHKKDFSIKKGYCHTINFDDLDDLTSDIMKLALYIAAPYRAMSWIKRKVLIRNARDIERRYGLPFRYAEALFNSPEIN